MKKILIAIYIIVLHLGCTQHETVRISVAELNTINFTQAIDSILIDVRTEREFYEGRVTTSQNIDVSKTDFFTSQIRQLDKSKHYFIICRSGSRSKKAVGLMEEQGFKHLYHVEGGILEWNKEQFPFEK